VGDWAEQQSFGFAPERVIFDAIEPSAAVHSWSMAGTFLLILGLIAGCVAIHATGIWLGLAGLRRLSQGWSRPPGPASATMILTGTVCVLFVLHLLQVVLWAVVFHANELFATFEDALYYSAASYSTVGYGDLVIDGPERILGSFEAMTGVLMFGWSTGLVVLIAARLYTVAFAPPQRGEG
jgi:hypothetical protein